MAEAKKAVPAPKQHLFVAPRDIVVTSTHGYSIEFLKGEPTHVPRIMHAEVMEKGILPVEPEKADTEANNEPKILVAPEDNDERAAAIRPVLEALAKDNKAKNFTAAGVPSSSAVSHALGWKVDAKEIAPLWREYQAQAAKGE